MRTHLVLYDLSNPGRDYDKLIAAIKRYPSWCHVTESTWLVRTSDSHIAVRDALKRVVDGNDKLFVVEVSNMPAAWHGLSAEVSNWIQKNL